MSNFELKILELGKKATTIRKKSITSSADEQIQWDKNNNNYGEKVLYLNRPFARHSCPDETASFF